MKIQSFSYLVDGEMKGVGDLDNFPFDEATGKRKISLKAPSTLPVLKFAEELCQRSVRK